MKVIIGGQWYPTIDGSSVTTTRSASDPVPTCTVNIVDNNSSLTPQCMQEILILDDQIIPNPTVNLAPNPTLNPYTTFGAWATQSATGMTLSQVVGGGLNIAMANVALNGNQQIALYTFIPLGGAVGGSWPGWGQIVPGQTYTLSCYVQGLSSPTGFGVYLYLRWLDVGENQISFSSQTGPIPPSTSLTRYAFSVVAPANAAAVEIRLGVTGPSSTNSGSVNLTNIQLEPNWFPTISYPTPFCGPSQTNCVQLPLGQWIRQYRKFAGIVNHTIAQDYHGNVRTLVVNAVGYAWLMSVVTCNDTFTSKTDAQIISTLLGKYLLSRGVAMLTTTNVITGQTLTSVQSNWDDLRTIFDNLAAQSTYYWTVDYYWNMIYAPPGYISMPISLICDNSSTPDMVATFPAYAFSAESDYTQPGSNILVIGNGTNVAQVIDPSVIAQIGVTSGYWLPTTTSWMRKVNESSLNSVADCTQRGQAELFQFDGPRNIYHLTTNVEVVPGNSIQVTSNTDNLNQTTLLIQQTTATWIGSNETLTDEWEYVSDLGATNKAATNIISRIFRLATANTSAPAISATTLALSDNIGIVDTTATGSVVASYINTIQSDTPIAYYRLSEITGTVADDFSGHANQGTIAGGPTLGVATLLTDSAAPDTSDLAITFASASSQNITLPTAMIPTGANAWSLECWFKITAIPASGIPTLMGWGASTGNQKFGVLNLKTNGGTSTQLVLSTNNGDITSGNLAINTIYYAVGTYDGTSTRLYLGTAGSVSLVAGPTAFALSLTATMAQIASYTGYSNSFFSGTIDEPAFYTYALSAVQVSAHFAAGHI